jgi:Threonine synthase
LDLSIFKCISCDKEYNIQEIRYRCDCGELLEVLHDLETAIPNPQSWKESLDVNMGEIAFSRYKPLLFPSLPNIALITLSEGDTPLYDVTHSFPQFNGLK